MLARRTVAATDVPALRTSAEMKPPAFGRRQAFHTSVATWFRSGVDSALILLHRDLSFRRRMSSNEFKPSSHQQDLADATLLRRRLSLGRFTKRQLLANWDYELAIAHRFGHELERLPVEFREYVHHFYRWILRRVLRCLDNRCIHSSRLDLGDQLLGGSSANCIRHRIERRKIRNRRVVVGCDRPIRADSLRPIDLPLQNPRDHSRPALLRSEYRRAPDISTSTYDENRLARFDSRSCKELVAGHRHQRQRRRLDQIESLGNFRQNRRFHDTKLGIGIVRHSEHLVADGKAFHSRP